METNATALKDGKSEYLSKPHNAIKSKINNQNIYNFFSSCVDINSDNTKVINKINKFNIDYLL